VSADTESLLANARTIAELMAELERVKAERDRAELAAKELAEAMVDAEARLDKALAERDELENHRQDNEKFIGRQQDKITKALSALREIESLPYAENISAAILIARAARAEIEGEQS